MKRECNRLDSTDTSISYNRDPMKSYYNSSKKDVRSKVTMLEKVNKTVKEIVKAKN